MLQKILSVEPCTAFCSLLNTPYFGKCSRSDIPCNLHIVHTYCVYIKEIVCYYDNRKIRLNVTYWSYSLHEIWTFTEPWVLAHQTQANKHLPWSIQWFHARIYMWSVWRVNCVRTEHLLWSVKVQKDSRTLWKALQKHVLGMWSTSWQETYWQVVLHSELAN